MQANTRAALPENALFVAERYKRAFIFFVFFSWGQEGSTRRAATDLLAARA